MASCRAFGIDQQEVALLGMMVAATAGSGLAASSKRPLLLTSISTT